MGTSVSPLRLLENLTHAVIPDSFWLIWSWAEGQDSWPRTC